MGQDSHIPNTASPANQRERLQQITIPWKKAMSENVTHSFSDTNINTNSLYKPPHSISIQDRKQIHLTRILQTEIFNSGASFIKTENTRYNYLTRKSDLIDHCVTNHPEQIANHTIIPTGDSDHNIGKFTIKTKYNPSHPRYIFKRDYEYIDWDKMKICLAANPSIRECTTMTDPSRICATIQEAITSQLDHQAPIRKVQISRKIPIFLTPATKSKLKDRDEALAWAKVDQSPEAWRNFRHLRNICHKLMSKDKVEYTKSKLEDKNCDHEKWETAKEILGWKTSHNPTIIMDRGQTVTSPLQIANAINHSLLSKVAQLVRNLPTPTVDPRVNYSKIMMGKSCQFNIQPIGITELRKLVMKMKATRSAGLDGLSMKVIKKVFKEIELPVLTMINQSILKSAYPASLKTAKVLPLYKVATPPKPVADPRSYRGININNCLGKILDKVVLKQLLTYLVENNLVHEGHHGSLKGRSTTTAVVTIMDTWAKMIEDNQEIAAVAMDQSAAYDLIHHEILLSKMEILGIQPAGISWFKDYLADRQQCVYVDGATSDTLHIDNRSVIQGSVLSCALYLIYILDLPIIFHEAVHPVGNSDNCQQPSTQTFVDDIMNTIRKKPNIPLQDTIIEAIDKIDIYMVANRLSLNRDKTQLMVCNKDPILKSNVVIPALPHDITPKDQIVFLGVTISQDLKWNKFLVDGKVNLLSQLKTRTNAIKKLRKNTSFKFARNLANALFIGKFNYAAEIWGGAPKFIIKKFQSAQLEVARAVIGPRSFMWNTTTLLKEMDWMNVSQLLSFTANKLTYKILHWEQPSLMASRFKSSKPGVQTTTRLSGPNKLGSRPPNVGRTQVTRRQYQSMAYEFYSQIPESIQNLAVYSHFCKWMKKFFKYGSTTPYDKLPTFPESTLQTHQQVNNQTNPQT